jgi:hypothetical protein
MNLYTTGTQPYAQKLLNTFDSIHLVDAQTQKCDSNLPTAKAIVAFNGNPPTQSPPLNNRTITSTPIPPKIIESSQVALGVDDYELIEKNLDTDTFDNFKEIASNSNGVLPTVITAINNTFTEVYQNTTETAQILRALINTGLDIARGKLWGNLTIEKHPDDVIQKSRELLSTPGTFLNASIILGFLEGLQACRTFNKIDVFYTRNIEDYTKEDIKQAVEYAKKTFIPGQPVCIPIVFSYVRADLFTVGHIAVIIIENGILEYYDSKGTDFTPNSQLQALITDFIDGCADELNASRKIINYNKHQYDVHNCGVFVARHIYRRLINREPYNFEDNHVPTNAELDNFRLKICEVAFPLPNENVQKILTNKDFAQLNVDAHRIGNIAVKTKGIKEVLSYERTSKDTVRSTVQSLLRQKLNAVITDREKLSENEINTLMLLFTQTLLGDLTENLIKASKDSDLKINSKNQSSTTVKHAFSGEEQNITVEIDTVRRLIILENKLCYKITDRSNDMLPCIGYQLAKRTVSIPLQTLQKITNANLSSFFTEQYIWNEIKVVDWIPDQLPPTTYIQQRKARLELL